MSTPFKPVDELRVAPPSLSAEQLLEESSLAFGYFGNAVGNAQGERIDDAIERFNAVKSELRQRLAAA